MLLVLLRMNFLTPAGTLLVMAGSVSAGNNHPHLLGPMPPDPVTVNRAAGPLTPASLAVWQMTSGKSNFLWRMLRATETLSTPQLRTLCLDLLRIRRFYDHDSPQDWLMISAWVDREPAAAVRELLNIPDWEDRDNNIGDYDSDVEFMVSLFWRKLAAQDFPTALALAGNLKGRETIRQFFEYLHASLGSTRFNPAQAISLVKLAESLQTSASAAELTEDFVHEFGVASEPDAANTFISLLPDGVLREKGAATLREIEAGPKRPAPEFAPPPPVPEGPLRKLQELDSRVRDDPFPFPLFRAIRALSPDDSRLLVARMPEETQTVWLAALAACKASGGG